MAQTHHLKWNFYPSSRTKIVLNLLTDLQSSKKGLSDFKSIRLFLFHTPFLTEVYALKAANISTELSTLDNISTYVNFESMPILPQLLQSDAKTLQVRRTH